MTMQTDVKSTWCGVGPTVAYAGRTRLRALTISYKASAVGAYISVRVYDNQNFNGGDFSSFPLMFLFEAPTVDGSIHILIPGEGILLEKGLSVMCSTGTTAAVFYG